MPPNATTELLHKFRSFLSGIDDPNEIVARVAKFTARVLKCDRVLICYASPSGFLRYLHPETGDSLDDNSDGFELVNGSVEWSSQRLSLPLFFTDTRTSQLAKDFLAGQAARGIQSLGVVPICHKDQVVGWLECHFVAARHRWSKQDTFILQKMADYCVRFAGKDYESPDTAVTAPNEVSGQVRDNLFRRVMETSPWVIMDILKDGKISYVSSKVEDLTGIQSDSLKGSNVFDFLDNLLVEVYKSEAYRCVKRVLTGRLGKAEFFSEVINPQTFEARHFLFQVESGLPEGQRIVLVISDVTANRIYREKLDEAKLRSMRLVEYGNLIIIRTDINLRITDILGDTEKIFGVSSHILLYDEEIWTKFVDAADLRALRRIMRRMKDNPHQMSHEIRVKNQRTEAVRWVLLNAIPLFSASGDFIGWEGFGLDITDKRKTEEELLLQSKRIEALYEVSRALQVHMDPAFVALRGLRALIGATGSDCGCAVFYDRTTDFIEIVAAQGLSQEYLDSFSRIMMEKNLLRHVIENKKGLLIDDISQDPRANVEIARSEGLRSTIVVPLMFEEHGQVRQVLGAMLLYCRQAGKFSNLDFDLVNAASSQIALVARQAEYYATEKRQASSLAALYRLSHELSKLLTPRDVAHHAFPIIQEELACKRIWFGVLDELGTHLIGRGGIGPGVRQPLIDIEIDLELRHDYLDQALKTKKPVVVRAGQKMECSGLNRILKKLSINTFVIVPLVSLGQVVGVLIVEPAVPSNFFVQRRLPLLSSMANEMATVILSRRFEAKMADAEKMRMAGLLASGIAHNFNNLLQAVMGQASLIELQLPENSPLVRAAKTIVESSEKGARLIKQMLTLTQQGAIAYRRFSVNEMLNESVDLYKSLLDAKVSFEMSLGDIVPEVNADYSQIQQVVTNLVVNAMEAIGQKKNGRVRVMTKAVRLSAGEIDPELAPGDYVRIDIEDNGAGMDKESLSRCFEPFYTTKNVDGETGLGFGGTGLGLSLGYSILKQHDGVLTVRSMQGEGTVFSIYLPAAEAVFDVEKLRQNQKTIENHPVEKGKPQAIIYDIEENVHISVRSTLESLGFQTIVVSDRTKLNKHLQGGNHLFRLLILDIDNLEKGVVNFLQHLRKISPQLKINQIGLRLSMRPTFSSFTLFNFYSCSTAAGFYKFQILEIDSLSCLSFIACSFFFIHSINYTKSRFTKPQQS